MSNLRFRNLQKDPVKYTFLLFVIGACARWDVNIVGRLALSELLLVAYFPFAVMNIQRYFSIRQVRIVAALCLLYLVGISITDYVVGNFFQLYVRGAIRPIIIGVLFLSFLDLAIRAPKGLPFFFAGMVVSGLQNFFYSVDFRAEYTIAGSYRDVAYRYTPLVLAGMFYGGYLLSKVSIAATGASYIIAGAVFAQFGSRTSGILLVGTGFVFIAYKFLQARGVRRSATVDLKALIKYAILGAVVVVGALYAYTFSAPRGFLGERVQSKFEDQSQTVFGDSPVGIVLRGRPHILSNLLMMRDKPLLGHGSWPMEGPYLIESFRILGESINEQLLFQSTMGRGVGHSIIMGGASNHGVIGLTFWLSVFYFIVKLLVYYFRFETRYSLLMVPILISMIISMWITPLGTIDRMIISFSLAQYCLLFGLERNYFVHRLNRNNVLIKQDAVPRVNGSVVMPKRS